MFGLGMPEILLILAIALIVIGPKKLPELAKTLGRAMGEFKRSAQDFKRSIDMETTIKDFDPPASDLKDIIKEANKPKKPSDDPSVEPIVEPNVESGADPLGDTASDTNASEPAASEPAATPDPEDKNK